MRVVDRVPEDGVFEEDVERRAQTAYVRRAARGTGRRELSEVWNSHGGETVAQVNWTRTRMNVPVPRTLVVAT